MSATIRRNSLPSYEDGRDRKSKFQKLMSIFGLQTRRKGTPPTQQVTKQPSPSLKKAVSSAEMYDATFTPNEDFGKMAEIRRGSSRPAAELEYDNISLCGPTEPPTRGSRKLSQTSQPSELIGSISSQSLARRESTISEVSESRINVLEEYKYSEITRKQAFHGGLRAARLSDNSTDAEPPAKKPGPVIDHGPSVMSIRGMTINDYRSSVNNGPGFSIRKLIRMYSIEEKSTDFMICLVKGEKETKQFLEGLGERKDAIFLVNQRLTADIEIEGIYDRYTALGYAISENNPDLVELLLSYLADVSTKPNVLKDTYKVCAHVQEMESPLQFACLYGCQPRIAALLVEYGAQVDQLSDEAHATVMRYIAMCPSKETIEIMLEVVDDVNYVICVHTWFTSLHLAVKCCNVNAVTALLGKEEIEMDILDRNKKTPLMIGCKNSSRKISMWPVFKLLLDSGVNVNLQDNFGRTALHYAVRYMKKDSIELLLQYGADMHCQDVRGKTPVDYIFTKDPSGRKHFKNDPIEQVGVIIELCVKYSREPLILGKDFSKACKAMLGQVSSEEYLLTFLENNKTPLIHNDKSSIHFLHLAIRFERFETIKWFLGSDGAIVNSFDVDGLAALHHGLLTKNEQIVDLLFRYGADINGSVVGGLTPLWVMLRLGMTSMAAHHIKDGCKVCSCVQVKKLHYGFSCKDLPLPKALFDPELQKLNPVEFARSGQRYITLVEFATHMGFFDTGYLLLQAGAPWCTPNQNGSKRSAPRKMSLTVSSPVQHVPDLVKVKYETFEGYRGTNKFECLTKMHKQMKNPLSLRWLAANCTRKSLGGNILSHAKLLLKEELIYKQLCLDV